MVPPARISLTLSRHFSLLFIASGRSSGLHPVSSHSYCMYVRAGRPAFAWPYVGVYRSTSLMSLSLLLQQWPVSLVRLTWIVFVIGGRWPYSLCLVGCCRQDLFNIALLYPVKWIDTHRMRFTERYKQQNILLTEICLSLTIQLNFQIKHSVLLYCLCLCLFNRDSFIVINHLDSNDI